ncbi:EAL domain-containing protein [Bordetella genomosp. 12]|uniref:EAL domain-containing protein n=1 Tax=Bordetella genomosp. 12 TaxID=463035 RepID=UPI00142E78F1|nr:EAL domain-containing protein [Bordetella genomosp. 12]
MKSVPAFAGGAVVVVLGRQRALDAVWQRVRAHDAVAALHHCPDLDVLMNWVRGGGVDVIVCDVTDGRSEGLWVPSRMLRQARQAQRLPKVLWISDMPACALDPFAALWQEQGVRIRTAAPDEDVSQAVLRCLTSAPRAVELPAEVMSERDEQLVAALAGADTGQARIVLQPQKELSTGRIVGAEALIRWRQPALGDIPVEDMLRDVARLSLGPMLFHFVTERAIALQLQLVGAGIYTRLSVNASVATLAMPGVVNSLDARVRDRGLSAGLLNIEVTERGLIADMAAVKTGLLRLRARGFGISMDDFGTGSSSLERLVLLPFDEIKIDRVFVQRLPFDAASRAVVSAALELGRVIGASVVAEGIETAEQARYAQDLGCLTGQGYGLDRPMEVDAYVRKVDAYGSRTSP